MASVFKPTYLRPIPDGAKRCKLKGKPAVRYTDQRGKVHVNAVHFDRRGKPTGKMVCRQSRYWMRWNLPDGTERREKGFTDKGATEQEAARREREAAQAAAGMLVVDTKHLQAPIQSHVDAWIEDLERRGRVADYTRVVRARVEAVIDACEWLTLRNVTAESFLKWLAGRKNLSDKSKNEYGAAVRGWCRWLVRHRRLAGSPLAAVQRIEHVEPTIERRALTVDEAARLLAVSPKRRLGYLVALRTGLRRSEIRALEWRDLHLDTLPAWIQLRASTTKARRADRLPIRSDLARELRAAKPANARPTDKVIPTLPRMHTMRKDLEAAGIPYVDEAGRKCDFHGLRHTYNSWLGATGTGFATQMTLMRHRDPKLTARTYQDPAALETAAAVEALPDLDNRPEEARSILLRTGTDDAPTRQDGVLTKSRPGRGREVPRGAATDRPTNEKPLKNQGFSLGAVGFEPTTS